LACLALHLPAIYGRMEDGLTTDCNP